MGYERKANVTQIKHHWWWKANRVFDQLRITENHTGLVLLMEADNYIAEDALHMLNLMKKEAESSCPDCDVFSVGGKHDSIKYYPRFITNHVSDFHSINNSKINFYFIDQSVYLYGKIGKSFHVGG